MPDLRKPDPRRRKYARPGAVEEALEAFKPYEPDAGRLDGVTFDVLVSRILDPDAAKYGPWNIRCFAAGGHIYVSEGGVELLKGLTELRDAMADWLDSEDVKP